MKTELLVQWEIRQGDRVVRRSRRRRSRSFLQQYLQILRAAFNDADEANVQDITNTTRTINNPHDVTQVFLSLKAGGGSNWGIVVGSGTTAPAITDYALETIIDHGVSAGQLSRASNVINAVSVAAPSASMAVYRDFTNTTADAIGVNELGVYAQCYDISAIRTFAIVRDVVDSTISVGAGQNLRVTYTWQVTV